jgi:hypothetical protein
MCESDRPLRGGRGGSTPAPEKSTAVRGADHNRPTAAKTADYAAVMLPRLQVQTNASIWRSEGLMKFIYEAIKIMKFILGLIDPMFNG